MKILRILLSTLGLSILAAYGGDSGGVGSAPAHGTISGVVTTMAQARAQHMTGGMTDANIAAANKSGLTTADMTAIRQKLHASDGRI